MAQLQDLGLPVGQPPMVENGCSNGDAKEILHLGLAPWINACNYGRFAATVCSELDFNNSLPLSSHVLPPRFSNLRSIFCLHRQRLSVNNLKMCTMISDWRSEEQGYEEEPEDDLSVDDGTSEVNSQVEDP